MAKKIIVGLSGGVDSTTSLILLKKQEYSPIGVYLKISTWKPSPFQKKSKEIAKKVCQKLQVPFFQIDVKNEFRKKVVDYFISQYKAGKTPNPCIVCNHSLKFKTLFSFAKKNNISYIATGHYARIKNGKLLMAKDKNKDQSYYLSFLPQKWLSKIIFPLGDYTKEKAYQITRKEGFDFAKETKQSQDFCYLRGTNIKEFLEKKLGNIPGEIVDDKNNILGRHKGLYFYTIGQRKKIGLSGGPYYVKKFDIGKNRLLITKEKTKLAKKELTLSPFNFFSIKTPKKPIKVKAKVRYCQPLQPAVLCPPEKNRIKIVFDKPILAAAPGQVCVFYKNEICLGGGVINPRHPESR